MSVPDRLERRIHVQAAQQSYGGNAKGWAEELAGLEAYLAGAARHRERG